MLLLSLRSNRPFDPADPSPFAWPHLSPLPNLHSPESFVPASDDLSGSNLECERTTAITGGIKLTGGVEIVQPSGVVGFNGGTLVGDCSCSWCGYLG